MRRKVSRFRARGTFARGGKSAQKHHLNLRFKNPHTLDMAGHRCTVPRVHRASFFVAAV